MWHAWGERTLGNPRESDNLLDLGVDGRLIFKMEIARNCVWGHELD